MRKAALLVAVLLLASPTAACKKKKLVVPDGPTVTTATPEVTVAPTPKTPPTPGTPTTWIKFEPEPKKFTIFFPAAPERNETPTPSAAGTMTQYDAQATYNETFYALGWMDFPASACARPIASCARSRGPWSA